MCPPRTTSIVATARIPADREPGTRKTRSTARKSQGIQIATDGDGKEQPDDQEAAEGIDQPGEPSAPESQPPRPRQQEHPQPGGEQAAGRDPGIGAGRLAEVSQQVERVEHGALAVGEMRGPASGVRVPERQPAAAHHPPVEFQPGLELEHGVHQQPVRRLVVRLALVAEARRDQQHVGRTQHLPAEQRLVEERRDASAEHQR